MKNLVNRAKYVVTGENGASNIEIIVWMSVVLVIATFLFLFRDSVTEFVTDATNKVDSFDTIGDNDYSSGGAKR